ncbi:MAG TPA: PEP-CTERM sorting domain-containing protein [Tepidisphaeraceae bacterium]|jgi:hypothetical protein|nr:PEP-CTERM sorting domain-containing protein [Tepidisphaeraceae bacterium]
MKSPKALCAFAAMAFAAFGVHTASASSIIAEWSFSATNSGPDDTPAPSTDVTGDATATQLGMTNSYTYANGEGPGSTAAADVVSTSGTADSSFTEDTWRIRGNSNAKNAGAGNANGWNNSAPDYTQGAQFNVSTAGYSNIGLSFDWYCTTQGVANLQARYSLDGGSTWSNFGSDLIATPNDYYGGAASEPEISMDLSGIAGANNDPNFEVELVSVRPVATDPNYLGASDTNYAAAGGGDYNNNSGNWRFDNISITGTPASVPEPASVSLLGLAGMALLKRRRAK